jgi:hypothetical protein
MRSFVLLVSAAVLLVPELASAQAPALVPLPPPPAGAAPAAPPPPPAPAPTPAAPAAFPAPAPVVVVAPAPVPAPVPVAPTGSAAQVGDDTTSRATTSEQTDQAGARVVGLPPAGLNTSNFMDTRLTWTFGDDDVLHPTGQLIPLSQNFNIGDRPQYRLFFDNLNSRYNGRENLTHLVMYKKMPGFIPHLTTEAAVAIRFDLAALASNTGNLNSAIYDAGSYIRLFYNTNDNHPKEGISATFFPLDTDRFRLGYLYNISWGGTAASINESIFPSIQGSSPGLKVQYDRKGFYAFAGFKTASIVQPTQILNPGGDNDVETTSVAQTNYGVLGGLGWDPLPFFRFDVGMGYFQQGKFDLDDVEGKSVYTWGGSARVVLHHDMPVPQSVDFLLYRNDPMAPMTIFAPEKYDAHEQAWSVSAEVTQLEQNLKNFDVAGQTTNQGAYAGALQAVLRQGYLRLSATGITRDLNYVVKNVPGFIPFETLPKDAKTQPEIFGSLAADYYIRALRLTPGIAGGVQLPSTFQSTFSVDGLPASRTIVVRAQGDESILPLDDQRRPIYQARVSLKWEISEMLKAFIWVQYVVDNNATLVVTDPNEGTASLRVFQSPNTLGMAASLQARF